RPPKERGARRVPARFYLPRLPLRGVRRQLDASCRGSWVAAVAMANLITLSRLLLLFVVVAIAYQPPTWLKLIDIPLLIFVFVTDGLDGYVARRRGEASQFGAMFDIAVDRIVELSLWVVFTHLDL